ncbi:MAG: hypothetical protein H0V62_07595 [Gammaproteobacteria bacterium]|nr:hypothetical protein [Gammaproteobacteria bacterium]
MDAPFAQPGDSLCQLAPVVLESGVDPFSWTPATAGVSPNVGRHASTFQQIREHGCRDLHPAELQAIGLRKHGVKAVGLFRLMKFLGESDERHLVAQTLPSAAIIANYSWFKHRMVRNSGGAARGAVKIKVTHIRPGIGGKQGFVRGSRITTFNVLKFFS